MNGSKDLDSGLGQSTKASVYPDSDDANDADYDPNYRRESAIENGLTSQLDSESSDRENIELTVNSEF